MRKLRVLDLFSGIGGFSLGLERTGGFETVAFCEIEEFPRKVLRKHWPEVPIYEDVRTLTADVLERDGIAVDVITGGFPCQDISTAGKQAGIGEGTRSGLWSEIVRLTRELSPRYVIVENVANLLSGPSEKRGGWFGRVLGDLAECGYDAEWENIPASALGAPHRRERVWIVAYANSSRQQQGDKTLARKSSKQFNSAGFLSEVLADPCKIQLQGRGAKKVHGFSSLSREFGRSGSDTCGRWAVEPAVGRVANGVPATLDIAGIVEYISNHGSEKQSNVAQASATQGSSGKVRILRNYLELTTASPKLGNAGCGAGVVPEMPYKRGLGCGEMGEGAEKETAVRNLSELVSAEMFTSDKNVLSKLPISPRQVQRWLAVGDRTSRIAALGNAVVPQIPELIGQAILKADHGS
jgi:DNA (cytosine-5)-methyltransferase 1